MEGNRLTRFTENPLLSGMGGWVTARPVNEDGNEPNSDYAAACMGERKKRAS